MLLKELRISLDKKEYLIRTLESGVSELFHKDDIPRFVHLRLCIP